MTYHKLTHVTIVPGVANMVINVVLVHFSSKHPYNDYILVCTSTRLDTTTITFYDDDDDETVPIFCPIPSFFYILVLCCRSCFPLIFHSNTFWWFDILYCAVKLILGFYAKMSESVMWIHWTLATIVQRGFRILSRLVQSRQVGTQLLSLLILPLGITLSFKARVQLRVRVLNSITASSGWHWLQI